MNRKSKKVMRTLMLLIMSALLVSTACAAQSQAAENADAEIVTEEDMGAEIEIAAAPLEPVQEEDLTLRYDDYYSFTETFPGYAVLYVEPEEITSYVVENGAATKRTDPYVAIVTDEARTEIHAGGTGTATIFLVKQEDFREAQDAISDMTRRQRSVPAIEIHLRVEPAVLTMMLLSGQSNMSGCCAAAIGYHPEDSVLCGRGQVYSTYRDTRSESVMSKVTGIDFEGNLEPEQLVPAALNSRATAMNGEALRYPLNALTADGKGKTGPDAGLAYEWNRLSGEKVWAVNLSCDASKVSSWRPDGENFAVAKPILELVLQTYEAELAAGHFTEGRRLMYWLQGESDTNTIFSDYMAQLTTMLGTFDNLLKLDYIGIITTRNSFNSLEMHTTRLVQYAMACGHSYNSKVYLVSNENERWITDDGVKEYFGQAYPDGKLSYPLRENATIQAIPTTVAEVHPEIHYGQAGHNENGLTAARNLYAVTKGETVPEGPISWVTNKYATGQPITETYEVDGVEVPCAFREANTGHIYLFAMPANPIAAKNVTLEFFKEEPKPTEAEEDGSETGSADGAKTAQLEAESTDSNEPEQPEEPDISELIRVEPDGSGIFVEKWGTYYIVARGSDGTPMSAMRLLAWPLY